MKRAARAAIREDAESLARLFTLAPEDLELVGQRRGDGRRLAFALQLVWARAQRVLVADPAGLPPAVVRFVAGQLGVTPEALREEPRGNTTQSMDALAIRFHLQVRAFQPEDGERLRAFLLEQAAHTGNTAALLDLADDWMRRERVLRPAGETTIARLVYAARHEAEQALFARIAGQLSPAEREQLDKLCTADQGDRARLAAPGKAPTGSAVQAECERLARARAYLPVGIAWGPVTTNRRRQWAAIARQQHASSLRRYPPEKRYTLLVAFLHVRAQELTDAIIEMADFLIARAFTEADAAFREARAKQAEAQAAAARDVRELLKVLVDEEVAPAEIRPECYRRVPRERVLTLLEQTAALEATRAAAQFKPLLPRLPALRAFMAEILKVLTFSSPRADHEVLVALIMLKAYYHCDRQQPLPADAPRGFVPEDWRRIVAPGGELDPPKWELCLLQAVRDALRAGELTVEGSRRYTPWDTGLYGAKAWEARRGDWFSTSGLPADGEDYVAAARDGLDACARAVAERLPRNADVRIERGELVVAPLERVAVPARAARAKRQLRALLPRIRLPELLLEVDRWTGFSDELFHLTARRGPAPRHLAAARPALFAVLVAEATNLGLETMATATGMPYGELIRVHDWYFREDTLRQAITRVLEYHRQLPLTQAFGPGTTSASDGLRFGVANSAWNARHLPRYFGVRRGLTLYSHLSDQHQQYWIDVINCQLREATFVLDGLLQQDAPPIAEHATDSAGYTDLIFGLFELLGFRFAPRLKGLRDMTLYRAYKEADYGPLDALLTEPLRTPRITDQWDDLNRLAASLKDGLLLPSLVVPKLQALKQQHPVQQAIMELGRIGKTRHILSYIDDKPLRRRILIALNRIERLHNLARTLFYGRQGRFRERDYAGQLNRATALSLVLNAIIVWNTRYLAAAADALAHLGHPVPEAAWPFISPIAWKHIHLVGDYRFEGLALPADLRPLDRARLDEVLLRAPDNQEKRGKIRRMDDRIWLPTDDLDPE